MSELVPYSNVYVWQRPQLQINQHVIKIAAFDNDWSLTFPPKALYSTNQTKIDPDKRWRWLPNRVDKLKELKSQGYLLVGFSNQHSGPKTLPENLAKITSFFQDPNNVLDLMLISTKKDQNHKPCTGMFDIMLQCFKINPSNISPDSFYTGDADGNIGSYSMADKLFVENINKKYYSGQNYIKFMILQQVFPIPAIEALKVKELIILVGMQGSGKTTFASYMTQQATFKSWRVVDSDDPQTNTPARIDKTIISGLRDGKSVIISATNPGLSKRAHYAMLGRENFAKVRIFWLMRNGYDYNKLREKSVPNVAYYSYFKNLDIPNPIQDGVPVEYIWY